MGLLEKLFGSKVDKSGGEIDVEDLIQKLEKANYSSCSNVVAKLGEIGDERAVAPLIKALEKGGMEERSIVAEALGKIGDGQAVEPLIKLLELQCSNGTVYYNVTDALASLGDERAVEPLIEILVNPVNDAKICAHIISNLAQISSERAIEAIIRALIDYRAPFSISPIALPSVSDYARLTLKKIGKPAVGPLINAIASDDSMIRDTAIQLLGTIGDERAVEPLVGCLRSEHAKTASLALEGIGQPAVEALAMALNDEDENVRKRAEKVLKKIEKK